MAAPSGAQLHPDTQALRNYVTARDGERFSLLAEGTVAVLVTHSNLNAQLPDIRLELSSTIEAVKDRLYTHCGTPPQHQRLFLRSRGAALCELDDDRRMLGFYSAESGMEIHVVDTDPHSLSRNGGLENVNLVKKFELTDEQYEQRQGTLRSWIREQRAKDPHFRMRPRGGPGGAPASGEVPGPETVEHCEAGMRCEVQPGARRGVVRWVGESEALAPGGWVGVELDEPLGGGDGSIRGEQLFSCRPRHGAFVRGANCAVGDFPPKDDLLDDDDGEEAGDEGPPRGDDAGGDAGARQVPSEGRDGAPRAAAPAAATTAAPGQEPQVAAAGPGAAGKPRASSTAAMSSSTQQMLRRSRLDDDDDDPDEI